MKIILKTMKTLVQIINDMNYIEWEDPFQNVKVVKFQDTNMHGGLNTITPITKDLSLNKHQDGTLTITTIEYPKGLVITEEEYQVFDNAWKILNDGKRKYEANESAENNTN
jgi:hypothetical protein